MRDVERDVRRTASAAAAREALASGRGIIVSGPGGSGRSHFVRTVLEGLPTPAGHRIVVHDRDRRLDTADHQEILDAVADLTSQEQTLPIVVVSAEIAADDRLTRLAAENGLVSIRLRPFGREAMLRVVRELLGGPLDPRAVPAVISARDGGDLVVLREALRELTSAGSLIERDRSWRLDAPIPPMAGVRRLIFSRMGHDDATDPVESIIDVVALAPELGVDRTRVVLEQILGVDPDPTIASLLERGVLDGGDGTYRIHDPVHELMLVHSMARLRRRRLSNAIVTELTKTPPADATDAELVCTARLALPVGWELDAATLTRAAETALRSSRTALAEYLASVALGAGGPVEATFVLAVAESQSGRSGAALARLEELESATVDPHQDRTRSELIRLLTARRDDPTSHWNVPSPSLDGRHEVDGMRADEAELATLSRGETSISASALVDQAVVLRGERMGFDASLMALKGRTGEAIGLLTEAEAMLRDAGADTFRVRWGRIYTRMWDQPFDRTLTQLELLGDEVASLGRSDQETLCRWCTGLGLQHAGRIAEAIPILREALLALEKEGFVEPALLAHVSLAKALALGGDQAAAAEALEPVVRAAGNPLVAGWLDDAQGWLHLSAGRPQHAAHSFLRAAAIHADHGYPLFQIIALSAAARAGAATRVVDHMDELAADVDGECIALLVRQARALARREARQETPETRREHGADDGLAAEFGAIADSAVELGMHGHAAQSYAIAAELHAASGDSRASAAAERLGAEQTAVCGTEWFGTRDLTTPQLSDRELEIAELAVLGLSNRQIAERLVLSVRTVETHLLRVFRKTGIRRRSELARALRGSAPPRP